MRNRTQPSFRIHGVVLILVIGFIGALVALAEQDTKESDIQIPPRRQNETAAAYQRRVTVARNAMAARRLALAEQGAKESDIQIPPRRQNETEAAYQRRVSVAKNAAAARLRSLSQTPGAKESELKIPPRRQDETEAAYNRRVSIPRDKIPPRQEGETEDQYQRRVNLVSNAYAARIRAFARAHGYAQLPLELNKQASETNAAYEVRLCLTIRGLLNLHYPDPIPKRSNETDEVYQARVGAALRANEMRRNSLIARPGEAGADYFARLTASKEFVEGVMP